ncbi:MAG: YIP1 family protein [Burkholderiales bacterium]|nr:YIP1 family protein [Burkholderiales bacterium]
MDIVARVKNILLSPVKEWGVIDKESATVNSLYTNYAVFLALIPAVAGFIGNSLVGVTIFGITVRTPVISGLVMAIMTYALILGMLYVMALIINALAPQFDTKPNLVQALKVAVYSATPAWVVSVLMIIPAFSPLVALASIYSLVLCWLGLPKLMKVPEEKKVIFSIVVLVSVIVVSAVLVPIVGFIGSSFGTDAVSVTMPKAW